MNNLELQANGYIGFASSATFRFDNTKSNIVGKGFYAHTSSGWGERNHNLNIGIIGMFEGMGDIEQINKRLDLLESGGVNSVDSSVSNFTEKDVKGTNGDLHEE